MNKIMNYFHKVPKKKLKCNLSRHLNEQNKLLRDEIKHLKSEIQLLNMGMLNTYKEKNNMGYWPRGPPLL